jgi:hypothetical protein
MGLNIKNERVTALVRELADRLGLSQTRAIEEAVRFRLAELDKTESDGGSPRTSDVKEVEAQRLLLELRHSLTPTERSELGAAEGKLYDDNGLPA